MPTLYRDQRKVLLSTTIVHPDIMELGEMMLGVRY